MPRHSITSTRGSLYMPPISSYNGGTNLSHDTIKIISNITKFCTWIKTILFTRNLLPINYLHTLNVKLFENSVNWFYLWFWVPHVTKQSHGPNCCATPGKIHVTAGDRGWSQSRYTDCWDTAKTRQFFVVECHNSASIYSKKLCKELHVLIISN